MFVTGTRTPIITWKDVQRELIIFWKKTPTCMLYQMCWREIIMRIWHNQCNGRYLSELSCIQNLHHLCQLPDPDGSHLYQMTRCCVFVLVLVFAYLHEWHTRPRINSCQCLVSVIVFVNVYCIFLIFGQTIYPHRCDQWSKKTKVIWSTQKCYDD